MQNLAVDQKRPDVDNWNDLLIVFLEQNIPLTRIETDNLVLATFNMPEHSSLPSMIEYVHRNGVSGDLLNKLTNYLKVIKSDSERIFNNCEQLTVCTMDNKTLESVIKSDNWACVVESAILS